MLLAEDTFIEGIDNRDRADTATALIDSLTDLIRLAARLPATAPVDESLLTPVPDDRWTERYDAIGVLMGEWGAYWTTSSMLPRPDFEVPDAVLLPLADDLADIWRELKAGLDALTAGAALEDVIWEWRFGFTTHWARHATEALRALQARLPGCPASQ